ncbi:MAG: hypothetical protein NXI22_15760, partial [bacterium]|nr:hypothetical protein [bacterium]
MSNRLLIWSGWLPVAALCMLVAPALQAADEPPEVDEIGPTYEIRYGNSDRGKRDDDRRGSDRKGHSKSKKKGHSDARQKGDSHGKHHGHSKSKGHSKSQHGKHSSRHGKPSHGKPQFSHMNRHGKFGKPGYPGHHHAAGRSSHGHRPSWGQSPSRKGGPAPQWARGPRPSFGNKPSARGPQGPWGQKPGTGAQNWKETYAKMIEVWKKKMAASKGHGPHSKSKGDDARAEMREKMMEMWKKRMEEAKGKKPGPPSASDRSGRPSPKGRPGGPPSSGRRGPPSRGDDDARAEMREKMMEMWKKRMEEAKGKKPGP